MPQNGKRKKLPKVGHEWNVVKKFWDGLTPEVRQGIQAIVFVTGGILFFLSLAGAAGPAGEAITRGLAFLFGASRMIFPLLLILWGVGLFRYRQQYHLSWIAVFGAILFLFSFTAFWHVRYPLDDSWRVAQDGLGGGVTGFFLAYSLKSSVGFWGALLFLVAFSIMGLLIVLNISLEVFLRGVASIPMVMIRLLSKKPLLPSVGRVQFDEKREAEKVEFEKKHIAPNHAEEHEEVEGEKRTDSKPALQILSPKIKTKTQLSLDLLERSNSQPTSGDIRANKIIIAKTLENFGIPVEMGEVNVGPSVTQYTLKPAEGVKLSSLIALHNDLALALAAHPVRIEAPIPGRALVGIEVRNQKIARVSMREVLESDEFKKRPSNLSVVLGKDVSGRSRISNLITMPHLLIAGSTGSGKTVCINSIIVSFLYQNGPEDLRFIMVDPKRVELPCYNGIPHLLTPVITDVKKALHALRWAIAEMERRFDVLSRAGKRDLATYNASAAEKMPYVVVIIDELADIMVTAGVEAESLIIRLAQMARAVGIHLILATQRPSVDVITGLIKANITARIAFSVASQMDSRTILDTSGAEKLLGRGDMLFVSAELSKPVRLQGVYLSDSEIERVVNALKEANGDVEYDEQITAYRSDSLEGGSMGDEDGDDELLPDAKEVILQAGKASASLLQRRLRIGYARAARILDLLEGQGFIGPADGARPREILEKDSSSDENGASLSSGPLL
ncbi:DNA translocase FtsK 4TM domain-containing protein [Candidatus Uhrbacteria bacterium]|nr:DNA translocase FtsK 4TM domain-containing protein [Candidatus Uhrbacteria bacterium]